MRAVFLDTATFSIDLPKPDSLSQMQGFKSTAQDNDIIISRCQDADIIITNKVQLTKEILQKLPKLKLIQITATGMNNVDLKSAQTLGIAVKNVADYSIKSVPEHTFMLMLTAMRSGIYYHNQVGGGNWQQDGKFCLIDVPILDLAGRTLGIIGAGMLGTRVGKIAEAFGMNVLYAERQGRVPRNDNYTDFETVLASSDVLSLHCALTEDTHHLINKNTIAKMNKPLIVNMARGAIVDTDAIVAALNQGDIIGYASDVFEEEPPKEDKLIGLYNHPKVFFTPHNAWASINAQTTLWQIAQAQINDFVNTY